MALRLTRRGWWFVAIGTLCVIAGALLLIQLLRRADNAAIGIETAIAEFEDAMQSDRNAGKRFSPNFWPWDGARSAETETQENLKALAALRTQLEETSAEIREALVAPRCRFVYGRSYFDESAMRKRLLRISARRVLAGTAVVSEDAAKRLDACKSMLLFGRKDEASDLLDLMSDVSLLVAGVGALRYSAERATLDPRAARAEVDGLLAGSVRGRLSRALVGEYENALSDSDRLALRDADKVPTSPLAVFLPALRETGNREDAPAAKALISASRRLGECDAACTLARVALAVAEFRAAHGEFRASLDELKAMFADGMPLDPFTDAPFVYERTATGVRIASQGRLAEEAPLDDATLREKCLLWELKR